MCNIIIIFQGELYVTVYRTCVNIEARTLRVIHFISEPLYIPSRKIYAPEYPCSGDDKNLYSYFLAWSVSQNTDYRADSWLL